MINFDIPYDVEQSFLFFKGRVALFAILKMLGLQPGDEVILPGFTCIVVPSAVKFCQATPVYVDIMQNTYNINIEKLAEAIGPKTKAIIVQHTFGIPVDMAPVLKISRAKGIPVIEDCAHCLGSKYKGVWLGLFGTASFFSTQWSKPLTTGLGGMAIVNDQNFKSQMEKVFSSFQSPGLALRNLLRMQYLGYKSLFSPKRYWALMKIYHGLTDLGFAIGSSEKKELTLQKPANYEMKMGPYQANLVSKFFKDHAKIQQMIIHRKTVARGYENELQKAGFCLPSIPKNADTVYLRFPVCIQNKEEFLKLAKSNQIEIGSWFDSPLHPNTYNLEKLKYRIGQCPQAEQVCREIINLPTHLKIDQNEAKKIINFLKRYAKPAG